ncbi:MAG: methyltransferase domain-containing protein [Spirochaetaceae bacterium]
MKLTPKDIWATGFDMAMLPLERATFRRYRKWLVPRVSGALLEVGTGTGANIPFLPCHGISELVLSDVRLHKEAVLSRLKRRNGCMGDPELVESSAESLPFGDGRFDSALATLVFCSVPDQMRALREVRRVLKPGGTFFFMEHVLPEENHLSVPMHIINPVWKRVSGGCHLTRRTAEAIEEAGFTVEHLRRDNQGIVVAGWARS